MPHSVCIIYPTNSTKKDPFACLTLIHCPESDSSGRVHAVAPSSAKASSVSYAWSLPDPRRYRSRFLPMRWPDLVLDDWAFRRWRSKEKEGNSKAVVDEVSGRVEGIEEGEGVFV